MPLKSNWVLDKFIDVSIKKMQHSVGQGKFKTLRLYEKIQATMSKHYSMTDCRITCLRKKKRKPFKYGSLLQSQNDETF